MSIENAILELAAAIRELAASNTGTVTRATVAAVAAEVVATTTPAPTKTDGQTPAQKAVADAKAAAAAAKEKKAAEEKAAAEAATETASLDYDKDIAPALTSFAKTKGKDALIALLAKFGAKKGSEIKADDYATVLAEITEADLV